MGSVLEEYIVVEKSLGHMYDCPESRLAEYTAVGCIVDVVEGYGIAVERRFGSRRLSTVAGSATETPVIVYTRTSVEVVQIGIAGG